MLDISILPIPFPLQMLAKNISLFKLSSSTKNRRNSHRSLSKTENLNYNQQKCNNKLDILNIIRK